MRCVGPGIVAMFLGDPFPGCWVERGRRLTSNWYAQQQHEKATSVPCCARELADSDLAFLKHGSPDSNEPRGRSHGRRYSKELNSSWFWLYEIRKFKLRRVSRKVNHRRMAAEL